MSDTHEQQAEQEKPSRTLPVATVLALIGGFFDAYTYYERGGVFANAQTGNIVKLALAIGEGTDPLVFLLPILTFMVGTLVAMAIRTYFIRHDIHAVRRVILAIELALTVAVAFVPTSQNMLATTTVSFVCALQMETFPKFKGLAVTTTVSTGNLRKATESLYSATVDRSRESLRPAGIYLLAMACFMGGATAGVFITRAMHQYATLALALPYLFVIVYITKKKSLMGFGADASAGAVTR